MQRCVCGAQGDSVTVKGCAAGGRHVAVLAGRARSGHCAQLLCAGLHGAAHRRAPGCQTAGCDARGSTAFAQCSGCSRALCPACWTSKGCVTYPTLTTCLAAPDQEWPSATSCGLAESWQPCDRAQHGGQEHRAALHGGRGAVGRLRLLRACRVRQGEAQLPWLPGCTHFRLTNIAYMPGSVQRGAFLHG